MNKGIWTISKHLGFITPSQHYVVIFAIMADLWTHGLDPFPEQIIKIQKHKIFITFYSKCLWKWYIIYGTGSDQGIKQIIYLLAPS